MKKQVGRIFSLFVFVGILLLLLSIFEARKGGSIIESSALAEGREGPCSNETLQRSYAYSADGFVTQSPGQAPFTPIAEAGTYNFDGSGNFSTVNTLSFGGQIIPRTASGTYTVNHDCTGSANTIGGVSFNFAITRAAKTIRLVVSTPGVAASGTMMKQ